MSILNGVLLGSNPFFDAYLHSDFLGRLIFIGLFFLSVVSWVILIQKAWLVYQARTNSTKFQEIFQLQKLNPLQLEYPLPKKRGSNPYLTLYLTLKKETLEVLGKNRRSFQQQKGSSGDTLVPLSSADIAYVESHLLSAISLQAKYLDKNLYLLSTVVTLAPFLGLLGTVWGILTTFSELQSLSSGGGIHQMVLGGLSLALATTVIGLIDAIPALLGYNYLKNRSKDFQVEMECFANELLTSIELQYRKADTR